MRGEANRAPDTEGTIEISTLLIAARLKENEGGGVGEKGGQLVLHLSVAGNR